jgi:hypothetical protein
MTNTEQRRLTNWRLKLLQAAGRPAMWRADAGTSGFPEKRSTNGDGATPSTLISAWPGSGAALLSASDAS